MKKQTLLLGLALLGACGGAMAQEAINANVTMVNGTTSTAPVSERGGIYFSNDTITLVSDNGTVVFSVPIEQVRNIVLSQELSIDNIAKNECTIMPNPATERLRIEGLDDGEHLIRVFSMDGRMVLERRYRNGEWIDVNGLPCGGYLLQCGNSVYKFIKK